VKRKLANAGEMVNKDSMSLPIYKLKKRRRKSVVSSKNHCGTPWTQLVEALRYKPEDRGFDPRWCHWNSSLT